MPHKSPEARREYQQKYRDRNREKLQARAKEWGEKNREHRLEYMRRYYLQNPEAQRNSRLQRRLVVPWYHLIKAAKERAERKGVPFSLTQEWAKKTWTGKCAITGIPFSLHLRGLGPKPRSPSIDRIQANKGYVPDNCRFVLACVNSFKHAGTETDMYEVALAIVRALAPKMRPQ